MHEIRELEAGLTACFGPDRASLRRALARLRRLRRRRGRQGGQAPEVLRAELARLSERISASRRRVAERRAETVQTELDPSLPVSRHGDEIGAALAAHQVVIVCGETGSGKTTQLPKLCLNQGRGVSGLIGHTQPRRLAARSVAARLATELGEQGEWVGHKVRFQDRTRPQTRIKLMTDGILLAEIQQDRLLETYDTLIIDEAHERSLNIDFLLGYLKRLLPRRPDLKVIITSATIDPESFARHFGGAPIIEVSGRSHPVEIRYRPPEETADGDLQSAVLQAVDELAREGPGDMLVFLSGERDIRDMAEALRKHHPPDTEILPLYARLSAAEQDRVFRAHPGRRIVLATNVAETSLTVPGIRYVIDTGLARISRYSHRSKVQRLPVEKISQAAARQRAGRCGRVAPGICIRLYSEADFVARPPFTPPEIRRTNLASVILQMKRLDLGEVETFPFMDPPDGRYVRDGYRLLRELQALDEAGRLTPLGQRLAALSVDPRLGRMVLAGAGSGCLREILIIASALSIQDPREWPAAQRDAATAAHRAFQDRRSDFLGWVRLWEEIQHQWRRLSNRQLRRYCQAHFLSYPRLREWRDIYQQLLQQARNMGFTINTAPADYETLHRAILSGLLSQVAVKDEAGEYRGLRDIRLRIFPASALAGTQPKWIMAGELLETARLYALHAARIEPGWIEAVGAHLLRRHYDAPCWDRRRGRVMAFEKVTLQGLVIAARRRVPYDAIDPDTARELFLAALADGEVEREADFAKHNQALLAAIEREENKQRCRGLVDGRQRLIEFYRTRIPPAVSDARGFARWRRRAEREDPTVLHAERAQLLAGLSTVAQERFPDTLRVAGMCLPLEYQFEPGRICDGITLVLPLPALKRVPPTTGEWLVPGLLEEKILSLIKGLPKSLRRNFVPAADFARACAEALSGLPDRGRAPLLEVLGQQLERMTGVQVPPEAWRPERLAPHLRMHFRLVDEAGRTLAEGDDLGRLQAEWGDQAGTVFTELFQGSGERTDITRWDFGPLPERRRITRHGLMLEAFPALTDEGTCAGLRLFATAEEAGRAHRSGLRRLLMLALASQCRDIAAALDARQDLIQHYAPLGSRKHLREEVLAAVFERACLAGRVDGVRDARAFERLVATGQGVVVSEAEDLLDRLADILARHHRLRKALQRPLPPAWLPAVSDMRSQLDELVWPGFITATPFRWLQRYSCYLEGLTRRLCRLEEQPARDLARLREIRPAWEAYLRAHPDRRRRQQDEARWRFEEQRLSLFAQELTARTAPGRITSQGP